MRKDGFTLIELSVVLVIIALLVGGIVGGQVLLRNAELRALSVDINLYVTAYGQFQDKYESLPGDMIDATAIWGSAGGNGSDSTCQNIAATGKETCNGNGNRALLTSVVNNDERFRFWQHLANAEMIPKEYTGRTIGTSGSFVPQGTVNVPETAMRGIFWVSYSTSDTDAFPSTQTGNFLAFRGAATLPPLTGTEAESIDGKLDDGNPVTGTIYMHKSSSSEFPGCTTTSSAVTALYSRQSTALLCGLDIRL